MACWQRTLALAALLLITVSCILRGTVAAIPHEGNNYPNQLQPWEDFSAEEIPEIPSKRASNLGSRLMCQLDSRNCGAFNLGKKFVGYTSWLGSDAMRQRRTHYYTNMNSNQQMFQKGKPYWWLRNY